MTGVARLALVLLAAFDASSNDGRQMPTAPRRRATASKAFDKHAQQAKDAQAAGRLDEAAGHYREALRLKPNWTEGHWALATLLYDADRFEEAREHFRPVVEARPRDGTALALKALCDVRLREYDLAFSELQKTRTLGIPSPEVASVAAFHIALLMNHAGNPDSAFEVLRRFAMQGKDNPAVIDAFGIAMLRLPYMPDEVPDDKREMIRLAGRGAYHMSMGRRNAVGRLALEELVSRFASEPNVHYALGAYLAAEDPDAAIREFRRELRRDPDHYPSLVQVASLELRQGRVADALPAAESAARIAPNVPAAHLVLGRALLEAGETGRAVEELERGAALAPESGELWFALGRAYQRAGRGDDAERARQEFQRLERAARETEAAAAPAEGEGPR